MTPYATLPGSRFPPGASPQDGGVNFCVYGRHATQRRAAAVRGAGRARAVSGDRARSRGEPNLPLLARVRRRLARGYLLRLADERPAGYRADGAALRSAQGPARSLGARRERHRLGPSQGRRSRRGGARVAAGLGDGSAAAAPARRARAGSTVPSSTSSMSAALPATPRAASSSREPSPGSSRRSPTCASSA